MHAALLSGGCGVSTGIGNGAADPRSAPVDEDEIGGTAAEMRALADEAEAEAAEAEALAAAAGARARALQLRRRAERAEAAAEVDAACEATHEGAADGQATASRNGAEEPTGNSADVLESDDVAETEELRADDDEPVAAGSAKADESEADELADESERSRRGLLRRPKLSTLTAALAVLVILAALAGSAYMVLQHRDATRQRERVAEFAAAARQGVITLTSLDFQDAKQGIGRILDNSTGSFKDELLKSSDDFIQVVQQAQVVEQGTVQAVAVDRNSMTDDSAVVLVASTSEVTNAAGAKKDPRKYRLIVTITRDGDQLKMSKVEFVP
ncbi:hypothetical protein [Mycobacterium marinum]|uniref:hypothetical protein n=1 Tax=Mycobacterium marinum TaxID=1781 RepID=UPI002359F6C3|nr:hypothetical protein [Mycobacterium marinum]MDC8973680.1 hypothetical protein [Mycobacterium marinum]